MEPGITWYEVLGVLPGTAADRIRRKYQERAALLRGGMISARLELCSRPRSPRRRLGSSATRDRA